MSILSQSLDRNSKKVSPKGFQNYLKEQRPKGYEYKPVAGSEGTYYLTPQKGNKKFIISFDSTDFPEEIKGIKVTPNNIADVMFRTQQSVVLKNPVVRVGDKTGKASEVLTFRPYKDKEFQNDIITFIPEKVIKIDAPFVLIVGGRRLELRLQRVPYPSMDVDKLEAYSPDYVNFELVFDNKKNKLTISYSLDFSKFELIDDFLDKKEIINGFYSDEVKAEGVEGLVFPKGQGLSKDKNAVKMTRKIIKFYERMVELQDTLGVNFFNRDVTPEDELFAKKLYVSLVDNSFYSTNYEANQEQTIKFTEITDRIKNLLNSDIGVLFYSSQEIKINLMGVALSFFECTFFTKVKFKKLDEEDKTAYFELQDGGKIIQKIFMTENDYMKFKVDEELKNPNIELIGELDW